MIVFQQIWQVSFDADLLLIKKRKISDRSSRRFRGFTGEHLCFSFTTKTNWISTDINVIVTQHFGPEWVYFHKCFDLKSSWFSRGNYLFIWEGCLNNNFEFNKQLFCIWRSLVWWFHIVLMGLFLFWTKSVWDTSMKLSLTCLMLNSLGWITS